MCTVEGECGISIPLNDARSTVNSLPPSRLAKKYHVYGSKLIVLEMQRWPTQRVRKKLNEKKDTF